LSQSKPSALEAELSRLAAAWVGDNRPAYVIAKRRLPASEAVPWLGWTSADADLLYKGFVDWQGRGSAIVIDLSQPEPVVLAALAHECAHQLEFARQRELLPAPSAVSWEQSKAYQPALAAPSETELASLLVAFGARGADAQRERAQHGRLFVRAACHCWQFASSIVEAVAPGLVGFSLPYAGQPWTEATFVALLEAELGSLHPRDALRLPEPGLFAEALDLVGYERSSGNV
jgi:hypothetical protein